MKLLLLVVLVAMSSDFLGLGTARRTYDSLESSLDYVADRQGEEYLPVKRTVEHSRQRKKKPGLQSGRKKKAGLPVTLKSKPGNSQRSSYIPPEFNAAEEWKDYCQIETPNQGRCNSCWAVAVTSVMSDRTCILSRGKDNFRYSAHNLAACCPDCGNIVNGGYLHESFRFWYDIGIVSGGYEGCGCQPYRVKELEALKVGEPFCREACEKDYPITYSSDLRRAKNFYNVSNNAEKIQEEIMTHGPVAAGMYFDDTLCSPDKVYTCEPGKESNHAVRIIGWGEEEGKKYWLIANSYGCHDKPFFKVERGFCNIERDVWAGTPYTNHDLF